MTHSQESMTAKICSFARAYHSNFCKEKIFDDYLAYDMMGKEEYDQIGSMIYHRFRFSQPEKHYPIKKQVIKQILEEYISPIPLSRIAYAESKLQEFAQYHGECQYVICGAGVDTFAFRNANTNIQVFEIDHPATQNYKVERIRQLEWNIPENVHYVPVDFEKDDMKKALLQAGFDPSKKTFFSILGVTYYLTLPIFEETIRNISKLSTEGNMILFDYPDETTLQQENSFERVRKITEMTASLGETMKHGYTFSDIQTALSHHNFVVEEHMTPQKIQAHYFDGRTDNHRAFENVHFISAVYKRKE